MYQHPSAYGLGQAGVSSGVIASYLLPETCISYEDAILILSRPYPVWRTVC